MKKLSIVLGVCLALAGCRTFDPDIDREADRRALEREAYHQEFGCQFVSDHDSYRQCVLNTYQANKPKTFRVGQDEKGRSVAILRDETTHSFDRETDTYKTERVIVIETEERLVPVPTPVVVETVDDSEESYEEPCEDELPVAEPVKETWWDEYQKSKEPAPAAFKCPCEDPNAPCPQCVDK